MTTITQKCSLIVVVALALFGLTGLPVRPDAQDAPLGPSADAGLKLAETFCRTCHLVSDAAPDKPVTVGIPSFRGIANKPGQTGEAIERVLINPHPPMPDMTLTNAEIQDIIAYLDTLRTDKASPPLLSPNQPPEKTKYPAPT